MGEITFDANGDTSQKIVSVYKVDPAGANGKGAWVVAEEINPTRTVIGSHGEAGDREIPGLSSVRP